MTSTLWADLPASTEPFDPDQDTLVRQSIIGQGQLCEKRIEYSSHEGFIEPVSEAMCFGTFVHAAIEKHFNGESDEIILSTMRDWVDQILIEDYDWDLSRVPDVQGLFSEIGVAYRTYIQNVLPRVEGVVAVEKEIFLPLGEGASGTNIYLKGTPDIICDSVIRDTKTAGKGWKIDKAQLSIQASLYMALAKQELGLSIRKFKFDVYDRQRSLWTTFNVERRVKDINSALLTAYDYGRKIEAGVFTASPVPEANFNKRRGWYCSAKFCPAWNICDYKYLNDSVNEKEVAIRSW